MSSSIKATPETLKDGVSIEVRKNGRVIFHSGGKWLYPLFELEEFIAYNDVDPSSLVLHDRIAGRAAASLIVRLGIVACEIDLISKPALDIFHKHGVQCGYGSLTEKIACRTEEIITERMTLDEIYGMLRRNAGLTQGVDLVIENLDISYDATRVLHGLSLKLDAGEQLIVTGDNGSGKTTLLKVLIGAVPKDAGTIRFDSPGKKRSSSSAVIGYVHQISDSTPFPISTDEIVASGLAGEKIFGEKIKYRVELSMRRTGCFHLYGRNFFTLSGGEKQRVSLARCLCQRADLILMDEPTSFLDSQAKIELAVLLQDIVRQHGPTILLVSHDHLWIEKLGWKIKELKDGKLC